MKARCCAFLMIWALAAGLLLAGCSRGAPATRPAGEGIALGFEVLDNRLSGGGFRAELSERLNFSATFFSLELDSELVFVGDAGGTEPSRSSRRYGIELPIYYRLGNYVFDLELALTNSRFEGDDPAGDEIPGSIERVIAAGVSARYPNGVYGSLRARHFGDRPLIEDGAVRSDSSTVLSLMLGYRRASTDFRVQVLNLLDAEDQDIAYYYASRLPGEPAEGLEDIHLHPMEPRTVRASITWNF